MAKAKSSNRTKKTDIIQDNFSVSTPEIPIETSVSGSVTIESANIVSDTVVQSSKIITFEQSNTNRKIYENVIQLTIPKLNQQIKDLNSLRDEIVLKAVPNKVNRATWKILGDLKAQIQAHLDRIIDIEV